MQDCGARTVEWVHPEPPKRRLYNWSLEYIAPLNLKKNSYVHWKSGEKKECIKSKSWQYAMLVLPCSVMISARFALAGGKSAKSNQTEGDFFGSIAHNPCWISESFWEVLYSIRLG